ncbi:MAG: sodium/proline symporter, partial [Candidatus Aminicenantes bacterium]|nr:sodium/proline symporter [Candidatus Aminicenantes bacterium]
TFSVVILLTLFWRRFHGKAVVVTIVVGLLFTILWSLTGLDAKIITGRFMNFVVTGLAALISTYVLAPPRKKQ